MDELVGPIRLVLVLECQVDVLHKCLLLRRQTDDNANAIRKRTDKFDETRMKVLEHDDTAGKVVRASHGCGCEGLRKSLMHVT